MFNTYILTYDLMSTPRNVFLRILVGAVQPGQEKALKKPYGSFLSLKGAQNKARKWAFNKGM